MRAEPASLGRCPENSSDVAKNAKWEGRQSGRFCESLAAFTATNAEELPIPELPEGFLGITNREHLRCKNFRFAVSVFGPPTASA